MRERGKYAISCSLNYPKWNDQNQKSMVQHFTVTLSRHRMCCAMFHLQPGLQDSVTLCMSLCHRKTHPATGNRGLRAAPTQQQPLHHLPVLAFI